MSFNITSPFNSNYFSESVDIKRISYLKNTNIPLLDFLEVFFVFYIFFNFFIFFYIFLYFFIFLEY
jgi:hypothetical protein